MAIITKGSSVEKGNEVEFTLNITDLLAHASVSGVDGDWGTANPITNLNGLSIVLSKGFIYPAVACGGGGASFTLVSSPLYQPSGFTLIS